MSHLITAVVSPETPPTNKFKKEVGKDLGLHYKTIENWHKLARAVVSDYRRFCYLNGKPIKRLPLNPYQQWIMKQIKELYPRFRSHTLIAQEFKSNPQQYSLAYFTQINQQTA